MGMARKTSQESHRTRNSKKKWTEIIFHRCVNDNDNGDKCATCKAVHSTLSHPQAHSRCIPFATINALFFTRFFSSFLYGFAAAKYSACWHLFTRTHLNLYRLTAYSVNSPLQRVWQIERERKRKTRKRSQSGKRGWLHGISSTPLFRNTTLCIFSLCISPRFF